MIVSAAVYSELYSWPLFCEARLQKWKRMSVVVAAGACVDSWPRLRGLVCFVWKFGLPSC